MNDGMNVAKIAAAPILRMIGMRFPNSAHVNPPIDSRTIAIKMSEGTVPVAANPAITASRTRKTGSGTMPILKSTIDHQPFGHQPSVPLRPAVATLLISCTRIPPDLYYWPLAILAHIICANTCPIVATRLVDHRDMRRDPLLVDQPFVVGG